MPRPVTPEIERRRIPAMSKCLEKLGNHIGLKDCPPHGVFGNIGRFPEAEQIAQKTGIQKIEFWALDQALGKVGIVGRKQMNDEARLKDRNPLSCRGMGNAAVGGKQDLKKIVYRV